MLSDDEVRVVSHAYALRHDEDAADLWFCPSDDDFAVCARLWTSGRLERRRRGEDFVYRLSDRAWQALRTHMLISDAASRSN